MIRVQEEAFDVGAEIAAVTARASEAGGIASFVGVVRGASPDGTRIRSMTLEHYPGMTERQLEKIEAEARERWPLDDCLVIHRYGRLEPGEGIVLVVTASAHRDAAFDACRFLMDWLKTKAPFWKREETGAGDQWVEAKESDDAAADRWQHG